MCIVHTKRHTMSGVLHRILYRKLWGPFDAKYKWDPKQNPMQSFRYFAVVLVLNTEEFVYTIQREAPEDLCIFLYKNTKGI